MKYLFYFLKVQCYTKCDVTLLPGGCTFISTIVVYFYQSVQSQKNESMRKISLKKKNNKLNIIWLIMIFFFYDVIHLN